MIDWISATLPLEWDVPINGGYRIDTRPDGTIRYASAKSLRLEGSHDSTFVIRSVERGYVEISGNPAKFLQGHNLFGSDDLLGLVYEVMNRLCDIIELEPHEADVISWSRGDYTFSRVDCTSMYALGCYSDVGAWLQAAGSAATVKWRGRGHYQDGTLYFGKVAKGKRASPWQMKLYHKGAELAVPGHHLPSGLDNRDELLSWASDKLRIEVTLRTQELKRLGLHQAVFWKMDTPARLHEAYLGKMEIGELQMVDAATEENLKPALRVALKAWKSGVDLRADLPRPTFYRYRKVILETCGVDIGVVCPQSNVIPLRRVVEARPAVVPDWAKPLLYVPPRRFHAVA